MKGIYGSAGVKDRARRGIRQGLAFRQWSAKLHSCLREMEYMPVSHRSVAIEEFEFARITLGMAMNALVLREGRKPGTNRLVKLISDYLSATL